MDDVIAVQRHHARDQLRQGRAEPGSVELAVGPDVVEEIDALDQVHGEEPLVAVDLEAMQPDQVGMAEVGGRAEFPLEAVQSRAVHLRQHLQGDAVAAVHVDGLEDDAHAAPPQLADQAKVAEPAGRPSLEGCRRGGVATTGGREGRVDRLQERAADEAGVLREPPEIIVGLGTDALGAEPPDLVRQQVAEQRLLRAGGDAIEIGRDLGPPPRLPFPGEALAQRGHFLERRATDGAVALVVPGRLVHRSGVPSRWAIRWSGPESAPAPGSTTGGPRPRRPPVQVSISTSMSARPRIGPRARRRAETAARPNHRPRPSFDL